MEGRILKRYDEIKGACAMSDLSMSYLGLQLSNPLIASSSPLTQKTDTVKRLEEAGIAAVVLPSLFEEQVSSSAPGGESMLSYTVSPRDYLEYVACLKREVRIPVIASLNGISTGGWLVWAKQLEEAGADALELNTYYIASSPEHDSQTVEDMHDQVVRMVRSIIRVPLAVKLSSHFSALAHRAARFSSSGADGLVIFNRFYQPDIDIESRQVVHRVSLSTSDELLLRLRWAALLHGRLTSDIAITGGVHSAGDVIKAVMAGASAAMIASALIRKGVELIPVILSDLALWLDSHGCGSLAELKGILSQEQVQDPGAYERAQYARTIGAVRVQKTKATLYESGERDFTQTQG